MSDDLNSRSVAQFMANGVAKAKKRKARQARKTTEAREQRVVVAWLRNRDLWFWHTANEEANKRQRSINRAMGVEPGVPDILILTPVPGRPEVNGVAVEMKKPGEQPTPDQKKWLARFRSRGWLTFVCFSAAEAKAVLLDLGF